VAGAFSILLLIVIPATALVVLALLGFLVGRRSRVRSVQTPSCAHCLYPVRGLTTLSCPECGSDLREVGILTPAMRHPVSPWLAILLWTLGLPIPALVLTGLLASLAFPVQNQYQENWILNPVTAVGVDHIDVSATSSRVYWPVGSAGKIASQTSSQPVDRIEFLVYSTAKPAGPPSGRLIVDLEHDSWSTTEDHPDRPLSEFDSSAASTWLAGAADEPAQVLAPALVEVVNSIQDSALGRAAVSTTMTAPTLGGVMTAAQGGASSMMGPAPGATIATLVFWFVAWLAGCFYFYRRQSARS